MGAYRNASKEEKVVKTVEEVVNIVSIYSKGVYFRHYLTKEYNGGGIRRLDYYRCITIV